GIRDFHVTGVQTCALPILAHQKNLLDLLKKQKLTVVSVFHELNLASLYCDRLLLLNNGRMQLLSSPDEVLTESQIKEVYQTEVRSEERRVGKEYICRRKTM